jgi:hypothetical protein
VAPLVEDHHGILVVRDDLLPGGTKSRYLSVLFEQAEEVVYASPVQGGAQVALAAIAARLHKQATIFCAKRRIWHARTCQAAAMGAEIMEIAPGYLSVIQARAKHYCDATGALLAPFGLDIPQSRTAIGEAAQATDLSPDEVWCAAGSGTLSRALQSVWPCAEHHVVQVGHTLSKAESRDAIVHPAGVPFNTLHKGPVPFPSDRHYDAKAWAACLSYPHKGNIVLFWNVLG